jgi:hypothetical protein
VATRPEPTINGNCDSWDFIVGKLAHSHSPAVGFGWSLLQGNMKLINSLSTIDVAE